MRAIDPAKNQSEQIESHQTSGESADRPLSVAHKPRNDLDLTVVLRGVLSTAMRSAGAEDGFILVFDEGNWPSHWFTMVRGGEKLVPAFHARAITEGGVVGWVMQHRQGYLVDDLGTDMHWLHSPYFPVDDGPGSALCLPLLVYGRIAAVLMLAHTATGHFQPRHLNLLSAISDRAALSIESARLYEMVRRRAEEMAALYEVALNISADQPLDRLLDTVVAQAMDLLHCQGGGVFLWREDVGELELVAAYDPEIDLLGTRVAPGENWVGCVFEAGVPMLLDDREEGCHNAPYAPDTGIALGLPAASAMAVPLVWQGRSLGVLVITDRAPGRHFDHSDQHMLTLLANQVAAAIASVQLHEQTSRRLQELAFLNRTIQDITATLDLDEIFAVLTRRVKDLLGVEACSIAIVDRETDELVFRAASGGGAETVIGERVPWGQGIVGVAAESGEAVNVSDVKHDERFFHDIDEKQAEFVTKSILAVPMVSQGQVVGVVEGLNKTGGFDGEDERLLSALASLAASVVGNANFVSVRRELEQLREDLTRMIVHDLRSPAGTISNSLELLNKVIREGETDQAPPLIDIASRATQRLLNMVDSLLDIDRLEAGQELTHLRQVSIGVLIQSAVDQLGLYARRKRIRLDVQYPDNMPLIWADGEMIERVLVNLIGNALKFTPSGGDVGVAVESKDDVLYVRVRDNGPGIPPEDGQRIFEKFARGRDLEGVGGSGLGLAFCRLAIEAHDGRIWVESSAGKGSTFIFSLPSGEARVAAKDLSRGEDTDEKR